VTKGNESRQFLGKILFRLNNKQIRDNAELIKDIIINIKVLADWTSLPTKSLVKGIKNTFRMNL